MGGSPIPYSLFSSYKFGLEVKFLGKYYQPLTPQ